jgi:dihydrolipoamide dehydrogenase
MNKPQYDLVVIGGGPGGYVAAIRAAQLGLHVACADQNRQLGGTCLRVGCIPSKALLESTMHLEHARQGLAEHGIRVQGVELDLAALMRRKTQIVDALARGVEGLLKRSKIDRYLGHARFDGPGHVLVEQEKDTVQLEARLVLIATGSKPAGLPGVELDGQRIGTSNEALSYPEVPQTLVVIGAGYIGLELGSVWRRAGSKVTVLEALDRILPGSDTELAKQAQPMFEKQGLEFRLGSRVRRAAVEKGQCVVECEGAEPIRCDRVLLAVGRVPNTEKLGLDSLGIQCDAKGHIAVDEHFATSAAGVYAIGDCIRGPKLAHKAAEEGVACVEKIVTGYGHVNYDAIPAVVFTHPEMASVGPSEEQLQQAGRDYRKGQFPFRANGRARTLGDAQGGVKILADRKTDRILGVHILGPRAGDLIAEAVAAIEFGASSEDLARCCHAHPTLSEALHEAALDVDQRAIHAP